MPVHNHALDPFLIRPSWLSSARHVTGSRVFRTIDKPESPLSLPFAELPSNVDENDKPVLELFLRAAESSNLGNAHRCSGCAGVFRENSNYVENAAALAQAALPSAANGQHTSTSLVLLRAVSDPMAQARQFFRSIEPMPAEDYFEHAEWWNVYLDYHMTIAVHVYWVVSAIAGLVVDRVDSRRFSDLAMRWDIRNYVNPWSSRLHTVPSPLGANAGR